nr:RNA-directed DNA polymerase, eukaryota [Tanacetum cinerariifolium]
MHKSQLMGVGVPRDIVLQGASSIGCKILSTPFMYLGVTVGNRMSQLSAWRSTIDKVHARLSKWKAKTLSVGGRLTLIKSILSTVPLYTMSIYKVPKGVLHSDVPESFHSRKILNGGLILDVLDDIIKVGTSMGYVMEGCSEDIEHIISTQGDAEIFK